MQVERRSSRSRISGRVEPEKVASAGRGSSPDIAKRRRQVSDRTVLIGLVILLTTIGAVMVLSASSVESILQFGSPWTVFERQLLWVAIGSVVFVVVMRIDYRRWRRMAVPLLVATGGLLLVVLVPHIGLSSQGSSRWVGFGPFKMQPSELAKLAIAVFSADLLVRRWEPAGDWRWRVRPLALVVAAIGGLVLKQPDMGTTMIIVVIWFGTLFMAQVPLKQIGALFAGVVAMALLFGFAEPYRRARLTSFLHPFAQRNDAGYQVVQSLSALGSGHILGVGLGAGRAKWGFLPNAYTDFIYTVIGEELGVIGALAVLGLFALLAVVGIRISRRAPDPFGSLLAGGITCWIVGQAVFNMATVVGLMPVTGVPLPFISYGGSSLVIIMVAMGIMVNIASQSVDLSSVVGFAHGSMSSGKRTGIHVKDVSDRRPGHVGRYSRRAGSARLHRSGRRG